MTEQRRRQPAADRARKRAIRALAAQAEVPYAVAARMAAGGQPASEGRTVYPPSTDTHRHWLLAHRRRRTPESRVLDARRAGDLPAGRAQHLADRFPPTRGEPGSGVGPLYHGAERVAALRLLYGAVAAHLLPSAGELAWEAELGEETAIDTACAAADRAARRLLDGDLAELRKLAGAALPDLVSLAGARHTLDAVLVVAEDGHAPGTRVWLPAEPGAGRAGTIVAACWDECGPPVAYVVRPDGADTVRVEPDRLLLLPAAPGRAGSRPVDHLPAG